jgi:hypothetical protein
MATIGASYLNLIDMMRAEGAGATAEVAEVLNRLSPVVRNAFTVEANRGTSHITRSAPAFPPSPGAASIRASRSPRAAAPASPTRPASSRACRPSTSACSTSPRIPARFAWRRVKPSSNPCGRRRKPVLLRRHDHHAGEDQGHDRALQRAHHRQFGEQHRRCRRHRVRQYLGLDRHLVENATHLIHPQGTKAGIDRQDKGDQRVLDANNAAYYVKEELFRWHLGVAVRDWRLNARVANIDVSDLNAGTVDIYKFLRQAFYKLPAVYATNMRDMTGGINENASVEGRTVIYMNRTVLQALDAAGTNASNGALMLKPMELEGRVVQSLPRHPDRTDRRNPEHRNPRGLRPANKER